MDLGILRPSSVPYKKVKNSKVHSSNICPIADCGRATEYWALKKKKWPPIAVGFQRKTLLLFFSPSPYWKRFSATDRAIAQRFKSNVIVVLHGQTFLKILFPLLSFPSVTCTHTPSSNQISPDFRVCLIFLIYLHQCLGWYKF